MQVIAIFQDISWQPCASRAASPLQASSARAPAPPRRNGVALCRLFAAPRHIPDRYGGTAASNPDRYSQTGAPLRRRSAD